MPKASAKHITSTFPSDPVVELSRQLLFLWDASDGAEKEFKGQPTATHVRDDPSSQLSDWRKAVETTISFTPARNVEGALVHLTLALDAVDDISSLLDEEDQVAVGPIEMKLNRLIRSAIDVIRNGLRDSMDPAVQAVVELYGGGHDRTPKWIDHVPGWAEKGSMLRSQAGA